MRDFITDLFLNARKLVVMIVGKFLFDFHESNFSLSLNKLLFLVSLKVMML